MVPLVLSSDAAIGKRIDAPTGGESRVTGHNSR